MSSDDERYLTTTVELAILCSGKAGHIPYPVTVVDASGKPTGLLYPGCNYVSCPPSGVGRTFVDPDDPAVICEVIWDGSCGRSLLE